MKNAYELAMERLGDDEDSKPLTDDQKTEIAEIDVKYKAKTAERKIFLEKSLADTLASGDEEGAEKIRRQIAEETTSMEEDTERAKERVRKR